MQWRILFLLFISPVCFQMNWVEAATGKKKRQAENGSCQCGKSSAANDAQSYDNDMRVLSGDEVTPIYKYPWMITISRGERAFTCAGSIIGNNKILTAAHCVIVSMESLAQGGESCTGSTTTLFDGQYCILRAEDLQIQYVGASGLSEKMQLQAYEYNPKYTGDRSHHYDAAVLTTTQSLPCDQYTGPICLPKRDEAVPQTALTIAGWGQSTPGPPGSSGGQLLEGQVSVRHPQSCTDFPKTHFCATGEEQNTCNGDSGGPAFKQGSDGTFTIVGISSFGTSVTCDPGSDEYFTNIYTLLDFVNSAMSSNGGRNAVRRRKASTGQGVFRHGNQLSGSQLCK